MNIAKWQKNHSIVKKTTQKSSKKTKNMKKKPQKRVDYLPIGRWNFGLPRSYLARNDNYRSLFYLPTSVFWILILHKPILPVAQAKQGTPAEKKEDFLVPNQLP